jgi:hypothetical protein
MTQPRATDALGHPAAPTAGAAPADWENQPGVTRTQRDKYAPLVEAFAALVLVKVGLRTVGFRRTYRVFATATARRLSARRGHAPDAASDRGEPARIAHTVSAAAAFLPWRALCLEQSLALCFLLRRRGHDAVVRLGVRPYPFAAHAWVEFNGIPLAESPEHLRAFAAFPPFRE